MIFATMANIINIFANEKTSRTFSLSLLFRKINVFMSMYLKRLSI